MSQCEVLLICIIIGYAIFGGQAIKKYPNIADPSLDASKRKRIQDGPSVNILLDFTSCYLTLNLIRVIYIYIYIYIVIRNSSWGEFNINIAA